MRHRVNLSLLQKISGILLTITALSVFADGKLQIAGQEGDERFFPLLQAIYAQLGFQVTFETLPSARAMQLVDQGDYDAEVGRIPDIAVNYPNLTYSQEPLLTVRLVAMVRKDADIQLSNPDDLQQYRIGYVIGMSVAADFVKSAPSNTIAVTTHEQLAQMLERQRIDIALMGTAFPNSPVYSVGVERLSIATFNVYHILHNKHAQLIPQFDQVLQRMKQNGQYDQLLLPLNLSH